MGGFRKESNNLVFERGLFNLIVSHISKCCDAMREDCRMSGKYLYNHENKISNRLVEQYLNAHLLYLRFILEKPEHYDDTTDTYEGRTDITVVSLDWFKNRNAYYTIECKRLDGSKNLNRKYVSDGISRFVISPVPKYYSFYGRNIMLGYIIQAINVRENAAKIDKLQHEMLINVTIDEMKLVCDDGKCFNRYKCSYQADGDLNIDLTHLFYDFSDVMREKS
jgi:hypothetical protein